MAKLRPRCERPLRGACWWRAVWVALVLVCGGTMGASAQVLPPHDPLRILIVSDEVNPHGLPPDQLTQPGEITTALLGVAGLHLDVGPDALLEVPTDQLEDATARLLLPTSDPDAYDVLVYFAHRIPNGADGVARQEAFVAAVDAFLEAGGGVVSFHHGIYRTAGKQSMQDLLGAEATGAVLWDTTVGQNVIAVAPTHFVADFGVTYPADTMYGDPALGIPVAAYPVFNNTPDEHYPNLVTLTGATQVEPLFASNYNGGTHLLGYVARRAAWSGPVVVYQPGEHQPTALEPGNNLQILLNAILYSATYAEGPLRFGDGFESGDLSLWMQVVGRAHTVEQPGL